MDMDFAISCPLVRRSRLVSGSCPSTRTFDPCFFQTPPRDGSPCIITSPSPPSGWTGTFTLKLLNMLSTQRSPEGLVTEGPARLLSIGRSPYSRCASAPASFQDVGNRLAPKFRKNISSTPAPSDGVHICEVGHSDRKGRADDRKNSLASTLFSCASTASRKISLSPRTGTSSLDFI